MLKAKRENGHKMFVSTHKCMNFPLELAAWTSVPEGGVKVPSSKTSASLSLIDKFKHHRSVFALLCVEKNTACNMDKNRGNVIMKHTVFTSDTAGAGCFPPFRHLTQIGS